MTRMPTHLDAKAYAVAEIGRLMRQYDVDVSELGSVQVEEKSSVLTRILSYVGGTLILSGLSVYLAMQWAHLDSLLRVALTLGPGLIAVVAAVVITTQERERGHLIATPLFVLAALFEMTGLFVFLKEYGHGNDAVMGSLMVCATLAVQFVALFGAVRKPAPLLLGLIFAHFAFAALFEKMGVDGRYYTLILALSGLMIATSLARTRFAPITGLGFIFSGFSFTSSLFVILERTPFDMLLIGVAAGMVYASTLARSRSLLFVGVCSMLGYLGYYTDHYFKDVVGWPIALMVLGILMIVASSYAVRIGRRFTPA